MNNPYHILDIHSSATDEQVKATYAKLQKKYHPDNYEEGPLKQLAIEKSEEITAAFDEIMNERRKKEAESGQYNSKISETDEGEYQQQDNLKNEFSDIRKMIQNSQLDDADKALETMGQSHRPAEWFFLKGSVLFSRGWIDEAEGFFSTAVQMDPKNREYNAALARIVWQKRGNFGSPQNGPYNQPHPRTAGCSACDVCSGLICADCCCECMGGDLISCC